MGYDYSKLCPYYEGAIDVCRLNGSGHTRFAYKVQCNGLTLPDTVYNWKECNNYNHSSCPQFKIMKICQKYGKAK